MSIITKTDNGIIYKLKDELVCIEAYGRDIGYYPCADYEKQYAFR